MNLIDWVDTRRPWWNIILTAGFHTAHTLGWDLMCGWGLYCALFCYTPKEGAPLLRWGFRKFGRAYCPYKPSRSEETRGWTLAWKVADSIADVVGPWLVVLVRHFWG